MDLDKALPGVAARERDDNKVAEDALSLLLQVAAHGDASAGMRAGGAEIAGLIVEEAARSASALQLVERMPFRAAAYDRYGERMASNGDADGLPDAINVDRDARVECQMVEAGMLLLANIDAEPGKAGLRRLALLIDQDSLNRMLELDSGLTALTETEFRLTGMLLAGHDLRAAAEADGVAYDTRRKQLRVVLHKLGIGSQQALVRTVMFALLDRLLRHLAQPQGLGADILFLQDSYGDELSVHDLGVTAGRLRVVEVGPRHGRPVVFVHPMMLAALPLPEQVDLLHKHNLRVLVPLRSGFHGSDLDVPLTDPVAARMAAYAAAVEQMLDIFGVARAPVISIILGAPWAVSVCKQLGERAEQLLFVGPPVPPHRMPNSVSQSFVRAITSFAWRMPHAVEALVRLHSKLLSSERLMAKGLLHAYRESQVDTDVVQALIDRGWLQKWLRMAVTYSVNGIAADLLANAVDWDIELGQLACPLHFLTGADDKVGDNGIMAEIAAMHPHATLEVLPDEGQLFYLQKPELIFERV